MEQVVGAPVLRAPAPSPRRVVQTLNRSSGWGLSQRCTAALAQSPWRGRPDYAASPGVLFRVHSEVFMTSDRGAYSEL